MNAQEVAALQGLVAAWDGRATRMEALAEDVGDAEAAGLSAAYAECASELRRALKDES